MTTLQINHPELGKRFGDAMRKMGMKPEDLAVVTGTTAATIYRIKKGQTCPRPKLAAALARALGTTVLELLGESTPRSLGGTGQQRQLSQPELDNSPLSQIMAKMAECNRVIQAAAQAQKAADAARIELQRLSLELVEHLN